MSIDERDDDGGEEQDIAAAEVTPILTLILFLTLNRMLTPTGTLILPGDGYPERVWCNSPVP